MTGDAPKIIITGMGSISPLGGEPNKIWRNYLKAKSKIRPVDFHGEKILCAPLGDVENSLLDQIHLENKHHRHVDRSVLMAIYAARQSREMAQWDNGERVGISLGSSRGATSTWESHYQTLLEKGKVSPLTSPTTTLGNISSWVAQDLKVQGPDISHSMTCTTSLHAIANGVAWLKAGLTDCFLAGGSEAPLTPFTFNQFQSLGIYSQDVDHPFPCRPMVDEDPLKNRMVIGEGSAVFAMERLANQRDKNIIATIEALGFGVETLEHDTSISEEGHGFEISMLQALDQIEGPDVDMVILHAPGTAAGDTAELNAIYRVFGDSHPILISNKWLLGHSFGASAGLSIETAIHILHNDQYRDFPYSVRVRFNDRSINRIMINAAGFGGNCTSLIISR